MHHEYLEKGVDVRDEILSILFLDASSISS